MTIQDHASLRTGFDDFQDFRFCRSNPVEVHDFTEAVDPRDVQKTTHFFAVHFVIGIFEAGKRGNGGRSKNKRAEGKTVSGFHQRFHTFVTHDVGDFVGIGSHCGGTAGNHCLRKIRRDHHTAFQMHMGIDETGKSIFSAAVDDVFSGVMFAQRSHVGTGIAYDPDVRQLDFVVEYIDHLYVFDGQIKGDLS